MCLPLTNPQPPGPQSGPPSPRESFKVNPRSSTGSCSSAAQKEVNIAFKTFPGVPKIGLNIGSSGPLIHHISGAAFCPTKCPKSCTLRSSGRCVFPNRAWWVRHFAVHSHSCLCAAEGLMCKQKYSQKKQSSFVYSDFPAYFISTLHCSL